MADSYYNSSPLDRRASGSHSNPVRSFYQNLNSGVFTATSFRETYELSLGLRELLTGLSGCQRPSHRMLCAISSLLEGRESNVPQTVVGRGFYTSRGCQEVLPRMRPTVRRLRQLALPLTSVAISGPPGLVRGPPGPDRGPVGYPDRALEGPNVGPEIATLVPGNAGCQSI